MRSQKHIFRRRVVSLCLTAAFFFGAPAQSFAAEQTETDAVRTAITKTEEEPFTVGNTGFSTFSDFDFASDFFRQNTQGVANTLKVLDARTLPFAEKMLALSLQGILAKEQARIYLIESDTYAFWLEDLKENWGIDYAMVPGNDVWALCEEFKDDVADKGFVSYQAETESVNTATVIAGQERYLMVEESIALRAVEAGFIKKADAADTASANSLLSRYESSLNRSMLFFQNPKLSSTRDFGIEKGLLYAFPKQNSEYASLLGFLDVNGVLMGWHADEVSGVKEASQIAAITMASDHSQNLSVFANLPRQVFKQTETKDNSREGKVHYVTFMLSDGDNVQWYQNDALQSERNFASPLRGEIPYGWTLAPALTDLSPNVVRYGYASATENDYFVTSVSGFGYINPDQYPPDALTGYAERTSYYMEKAGSQYLQLLDNEATTPTAEVLSAFTSQPQIQGIFYETGDRYVEAKGKLWWSDGKPVVAIRESLWTVQGPNSEEACENIYEMARRISNYNKTPDSISGYTAINVHVWSHDYEDCVEMAAWWQEHDPNVVVVTPDQFMELIAENVTQKDASPRVSLFNYLTFAFRAIGSVLKGVVTLFRTGSYENTFLRKN